MRGYLVVECRLVADGCDEHQMNNGASGGEVQSAVAATGLRVRHGDHDARNSLSRRAQQVHGTQVESALYYTSLRLLLGHVAHTQPGM